MVKSGTEISVPFPGHFASCRSSYSHPPFVLLSTVSVPFKAHIIRGTILCPVHRVETSGHLVSGKIARETLFALGRHALPWAGLSLRGKKKRKGFVMPTETNVHRDVLCFMVVGHSLFRRLAVGGWRLVLTWARFSKNAETRVVVFSHNPAMAVTPGIPLARPITSSM